MPFTPFHMGAALALKPAMQARFSVLIFGVSQVAIDIEPLVRLLRGDAQVHGWSHSVVGAIAIGAASAVLGRPVANGWLVLLRRGQVPATFTHPVTLGTALASAWIGTGSHLVLDGIMHGDMRPFAPITAANPLLALVPLTTLHLGLVLAGLAGLLLLAVMLGRGGSRGRGDRGRPR